MVGDRPLAAATAAVASVGVTGVTVKHSLFVVAGGTGVPSSLAFGTPVVPEMNWPNQQYRPADVRLAKPVVVPLPDAIGWEVLWFTLLMVDTRTPWLSHAPVA